MNIYCGTLVLTLVLTLGVYDGFCMLDESKAYLEPENQVKKVGDKGQFKCRSPAGYHSEYEVFFSMEHNGTLKFDKRGPNKITYDKFSWGIFKITSLKREDAGTYKCIIDNGVNVTAESKLFVIEDDHRPIFVKDGDSSTVKCFDSTSLGFIPHVECLWGDKKVCHGEVSCCSIKPEKDNDLNDPKPITCKVTTKAAFEKNKKFDNESSTELKKEVSVVSWNACEEIPCTLIANVYGLTPVQIFWTMAGENISSTEEESSSMLTSTTDPINITGVVLLTVSGGGVDQSWNISMATKEAATKEDSKSLAIILGITFGFIGIGVIVLIGIYCCKCRKRNSDSSKSIVLGVPLEDMTKGPTVKGTGESERMHEETANLLPTAGSGANSDGQLTCTEKK